MGRAVLGSGLRRRELQAIPRNYWLDLLLQTMATLKCAFLLFTLAYTCHAKWVWKEDYPVRDEPAPRYIPSRYDAMSFYDAVENDPGNDCQDLLRPCRAMERYCESDD